MHITHIARSLGEKEMLCDWQLLDPYLYVAFITRAKNGPLSLSPSFSALFLGHYLSPSHSMSGHALPFQSPVTPSDNFHLPNSETP